jgi:hypothetical protein
MASGFFAHGAGGKRFFTSFIQHVYSGNSINIPFSMAEIMGQAV